VIRGWTAEGAVSVWRKPRRRLHHTPRDEARDRPGRRSIYMSTTGFAQGKEPHHEPHTGVSRTRYASRSNKIGVSRAHQLKPSNFFRKKYWMSYQLRRLQPSRTRVGEYVPSCPELLNSGDITRGGNCQWVAGRMRRYRRVAKQR
jgi:hypothetical protein